MLAARRVLAEIWRLYRNWAVPLLGLGLVVFIPVDLLDVAAAEADLEKIEFGGLVELITAALAVGVLAITALLGEIFYTGAVAVLLTRSRDHHAPSLRQIAGEIRYGRIAAIDLIYGLAVALGLVLLIVPGFAAFVWLALAGPLVEIEDRGIRDAFARSVRLIRGRFWTVLAVLVPIQLAGSAATGLATWGAHGLFGDSLVGHWLAEVLGDLVVTPFYAVAAVVITVWLIREKEGSGPRLHSTPVSA